MPQKRVLIIDDEPDFVDLTEMRLEANGFSVATAYNGSDGLDKAKEEKPQLILLDIMMPEMDGFQVLKALRRDPATSRIPVIMLTAKGETESIFKAKDLGSTDYLIKPCEADELIRWVNRHIL